MRFGRDCSAHWGGALQRSRILTTMAGPLKGTQSTSTIVARLSYRAIPSLRWAATAPFSPSFEPFSVGMVNNRE